jgi:3-oxoacid CoA-transferase subunit A
MIYITGDTHRNFDRVASFCKTARTTRDDVLIILGDAGINYPQFPHDPSDRIFKMVDLAKLPITLLCIHGNHEKRPETIDTYNEISWREGTVYMEPEFPNLLFAKDGEIYSLAGKHCLVIGGAYSVDKHIRISRNISWWPDEQPSDIIKNRVEERLQTEDWIVDVVLTHTCPYSYLPREMFLSYVKEEDVDHTTERWLDKIEQQLTYSNWYCGHFHTDKTVDKIRFMYKDFLELK